MKKLTSTVGALVLFLSVGASASNPRDPNMSFIMKPTIQSETCEKKATVAMGDASSIARAAQLKENLSKSGAQR